MHIDSTLPSALQTFCVRNQNKIDIADDDRTSGDGYWIYLSPGWVFDGDCHIVHEYTVKDVIKAFKRVTPCECSQCLAGKIYYGYNKR